MTTNKQDDERIVVLAPMGRDASLACNVLTEAGLTCLVCQNSADLRQALAAGAGAVLLTEEALTPDVLAVLIEMLEAQPAWSDLPLVVLEGHASAGRSVVPPAVQELVPGRNVTRLRRPVSISTLVTVMHSALRARRRQYELRQHLLERERILREVERQVEERTAELTYVNATLEEQIEERERVEERLKQRNQELAMLNMVTAAASSSLDLPQIFETLKGLLVEQFDIPGGAIFLYNEFADRLELWASWNLPQNVLDAVQDRSVDSSHLERVVRQHEIVFWSDFRKLDLFVRLGLDEDRPSWQSHMCVPLLAKGQIQGVLDLFSRAPAVFTRDQAVLFLTLGRQVGVAIQNARLFDEVVTKRERLRHLTQQVVKAQEEERQRVSRELHDEAGQALTALKISLDMTQATLPPRLTTARQSIAEAVALTDETMERIRLLAQDLRPPSLDHLGLNSTLEGLCHEFANRAHLSIEYEGAPLPPLPGSRAIALYRVAQEALTNVARHADASEVQVAVDYDAGSIALAVKDNGRGFNLRASKNGIGLSGMRERMELFGGRLEVNTAPGQGTEIVATLPWPEVAR